MQGHGRIIAPDFCVAHREANSGLSTLNRTKSILSIYHQQRQLQKQRGMCLNDTYPFCQQPLSGNCHSICFSKPVLWAATSRGRIFRDCPKRARPFLGKRLAVCRAHNLSADGGQIPHLQTEKYFLPGTRPGKKWIALDLPPAGGKLCEAFLG